MSRITKRKWQVRELSPDSYSRFHELNGEHDWQMAMPNTFVLYPVRKLTGGQLIYFNFQLAKEMGLISSSHENEMNKKLEKAILDTFCLRIINEYDRKQNIRYMPNQLMPHPYMATRYLQLQHSNKRGMTSGDGRSIWNGQIAHNGTIWDVSSRGTGVTCLAPGFVEAQKPIRSGSTQFGYGCGLADLDELLGAAILSEIFHQNGVGTERVLAVIDTGNGNGIGVRAAPNLMRPAHIFMHLKQGHLEGLRQAADYFINREYHNGRCHFSAKNNDRYRLMLKNIAMTFAEFAAKLDREYIFAWLDWDGDNILANAGIIDYGSIRQFGLRHDQYRYDDVERFSTNLNEQKYKAREIVQTFAQAFDFLRYGKKRKIENYQTHWSVRLFEHEFRRHVLGIFLKQLGYSQPHAEYLQTHHPILVERLYKSFRILESTKTRNKMKKVADGINRPAILNMRRALIDLAKLVDDVIQKDSRWVPLPRAQLFTMMLAESAKGKDRKPSISLLKQMQNFECYYIQCLRKITANFGSNAQTRKSFGRSFRENASQMNHQDRLTGDALLYIVDEIISQLRRKKITAADAQKAIDKLIAKQGPHANSRGHSQFDSLGRASTTGLLQQVLLRIIDAHKECI